jgi:hypothetical protein
MRYRVGMSADDLLQDLAAIAAERKEAEANLDALKQREHDAIAAAWRAQIPPTKIAAAAHRTAAHIRTLRPDDVPPARLGGGAAKQRPRKRAGKG